MPTKIGLMGCGVVAVYGHIPAILETSELQLHAVYDPNEATLRRVQERFGIPHAFSDAKEFFQSGIAGVSITSPAPFHKDNVLACARHRLPALCEKPLAMDGEEGRLMAQAMDRAGVSLYVAFCYRFSPVALRIRELVRTGAISDVRSLRLIYNWDAHGKYAEGPDGSKIIQKRREDRMLEGGPMVDCGTHQIDLAAFWLDSKVVGYSGHGAWVDGYEAPDHMWLHMDHANGAHTAIEISYSYHHTSKNTRSEFVYELIGTSGVIRYDRQAASFSMENESGRQEFEFHPEKEFSAMYREWANALRSGHSDLLTSAEEGVVVAEIARAATDDVIRRGTGRAPARQTA
ncbi:MAG: Gfo/Idh/MocA family oxidoreductase [Verrucomicrobiota bacterium]